MPHISLLTLSHNSHSLSSQMVLKQCLNMSRQSLGCLFLSDERQVLTTLSSFSPSCNKQRLSQHSAGSNKRYVARKERERRAKIAGYESPASFLSSLVPVPEPELKSERKISSHSGRGVGAVFWQKEGTTADP